MSSLKSPSTNPADYTFDVNKSTLFREDAQNSIDILSQEQLPTLQNISLLNTHLSNAHIIEPHYHQNAAELVYVTSGSVIVSILHPETKKIMNFPLTPGQVANIPQGWWHYIVSTSNNTKFLAIFNASTPEIMLGSDILTATPAHIMAQTYCMDERQWKQTTAPIKPGTFIGPSCAQKSNYYTPQWSPYFGSYYTYLQPHC